MNQNLNLEAETAMLRGHIRTAQSQSLFESQDRSIHALSPCRLVLNQARSRTEDQPAALVLFVPTHCSYHTLIQVTRHLTVKAMSRQGQTIQALRQISPLASEQLAAVRVNAWRQTPMRSNVLQCALREPRVTIAPSPHAATRIPADTCVHPVSRFRVTRIRLT